MLSIERWMKLCFYRVSSDTRLSPFYFFVVYRRGNRSQLSVGNGEPIGRDADSVQHRFVVMHAAARMLLRATGEREHAHWECDGF